MIDNELVELVVELRAVAVYLRIVGAVYPIAPEKAIETIERTISALSAQLEAEHGIARVIR